MKDKIEILIYGIGGEVLKKKFPTGINEITGEELKGIIAQVNAETSSELGFYYKNGRFVDKKETENGLIIWI